MLKTTYALTLFAAVSLAAPVSNTEANGYGLGSRATTEGLTEHKNLIEEIPIIGSILGNKHDSKRDVSDHQADHKNLIDGLPIIGALLGNQKQNQRRGLGGDGLSGLPLVGSLFGEHQHTGGNNGMTASRRSVKRNYRQNYDQNEGQNYGQNEGQNEGQNYLQNYGQNEGQNEGQNYFQNYGQNYGQNEGQNGKRDLGGLSSLPIIGELFKEDKDKPSHEQTNAPAKHIDTRQTPGHSKGIFGILQSLTSGGPITKSHKRDMDEFTPFQPVDAVVDGAYDSGMAAESSVMPMRRDEAPKPSTSQQAGEKGAQNQNDSKDQKAQDDQDSNNLLKTLMGPKGLGSIKGNAHHGIGLFPMRRDAKEIEARQAPPIQGSTLTDVLLQGGVLGKVTTMLSPTSPQKKPGQSDPNKIGDGSTAGPPDPASGAGPHSGPGLAAEGRNGAAPAAPQ